MSEINIFIARLNQLPGVTASMIADPLDVRTSASLAATDSTQATIRPEAHFVFKLVRIMKATRQ